MFNENLKIPGPTGLQNEPRKHPKDWVLGEAREGSIKDHPILKPDGHGWKDHEPTYDYQQMNNGEDLNICVTESLVNDFEYLANRLFQTDEECTKWFRDNGYLDENDKVKFNNRIVAVGSGTNPDGGNTVTAVIEFIRKYGLAPQTASPWDNSWSKGQFYTPLTETELNAGKKLLTMFDINHEWLPTSVPVWGQTHTHNQLVEGLKRGVLRVSVDGNYEQDANGLICARKEGRKMFVNYNHSVTLRDYNEMVRKEVHDHYTKQIVHFIPDYPFGNAKLVYFTKKELGGTFAKVEGTPELLFYGMDGAYKDQPIGFQNGDVAKACFGPYSAMNPRTFLKVRPLNVKTLFIK